MDSNSNRRRVVGVSSTSSSSPSTATTTTAAATTKTIPATTTTTAATTTKTIPATTTTTTTATTKKIAAKTTTATTTTSSPSTVLGTTAGEAVASSVNRSVAGRDANPLVASNPPPPPAAVATDDGAGTPRKKAKLTTKAAAAAAAAATTATAATTGSAEKLQQNRPKEATRAGLRSRRTEAGTTPETRFKDAPKTRLQLPGARPAGAGRAGGVTGVSGRGQPTQGSTAATADGSRKSPDGSRKSADGSRKSADGPRRSADAPRRSADAARRSAAAQVRPATVRCTVEDCRNEMNDTQNRKLFYPIPDIPEIRKTWIDRIRQHNCKSGEVYSNYICVDHFSSDQKLTNGHLRGNAIPNIFIPARRIINCIYCGMTFESRGQLHQHDSAKHLHETRRWKLDCEFESVSPSTLYEGAKTQCEDCEFRVKMRQQMASIRVDLAKASMELANFERTVLTGHLQLKLPLPDDARLCSSDE